MKNVFFICILFFIVSACKKTELSAPVSFVVIKISGCDSIKQGLLKTTPDTVRLISCLTINNCDSVRLGILKPNTQDTLRLLSCIKITGCDSIRLKLLKPIKADTLRLLSCMSITGCDSLRLGILKPNTKDTIRLLSCIKITGCDSVRLGLIHSAQDLLRLNCNDRTNWIGKNLEVSTYRNGDTIPQVTDPTAWALLTTGAWCYYNNDPANNTIYGKLYNWYAVNDPRGLAPSGWHIPSDAEWTSLSISLGGEPIAGGKMKTTGTSRWHSPNTAATNEIGFEGLPGGFRYYNGPFSSVGANGHWWSATERSSKVAWYRSIYYNGGNLSRGENIAGFGFSVRCVRDNNSFDY